MKRMRRILLVLAVGAVCFEFGWVASQKNLQAAPVMQVQETGQAPIDQFRREREQLRAMQRAQLNEIIHDAQTDADIRGAAQRQLLEMNAAETAETTLEGVIRMRGWEDCVVTAQPDSVNVLLCAELITQQESSMILELVCRETGIQSGGVKIIPIN